MGKTKRSEDPREQTKKPSSNGWQWGCDVGEGEAKKVNGEARHGDALVGGWWEAACGQSKSADRRVVWVVDK